MNKKPGSPIDITIDTLNELAKIIEEDWTQDGTTEEQDNRFRLAAYLIRRANALLKRNRDED